MQAHGKATKFARSLGFLLLLSARAASQGAGVPADPSARPGAAGGGPGPIDSERSCAPLLRDQAAPSGPALAASSVPALGALRPLGIELFVDPSGRVGFGTLAPLTQAFSAGDLILLDGLLSVRGSTPGTPLELGVSTAEPRPHLSDASTMLFGGGSPAAVLGAAALALRGTDGVRAAHLEHGTGPDAGADAAGPDGAALYFTADGLERRFDAHVGTGAGRVLVETSPSGGTLVFDGGSDLARARLQVDEPGGGTELLLQAARSSGLGPLLTLNGSGGASVALDGDFGSSAVLDLTEPGGRGLQLTGGGITSGSVLRVLDASGGARLELRPEESGVPGGGLRMDGLTGSETISLRAATSVEPQAAQLTLRRDTGAASVQTVLLKPAPAPTRMRVVSLSGTDGSGRALYLLAADATGGEGSGLEAWDGGQRLRFNDHQMVLFDANGDLTIFNDGVSGTKSACVPTSEGRRLVYCSEAAEVWFEDRGAAQLRAGTATIVLDPLFRATVRVDAEHPLHVTVTLRGEAQDVWIEKHADGFVVHAGAGVADDARFDWRVQAKRRGLANARLAAWR